MSMFYVNTPPETSELIYMSHLFKYDELHLNVKKNRT